jgi:hypothetical protein
MHKDSGREKCRGGGWAAAGGSAPVIRRSGIRARVFAGWEPSACKGATLRRKEARYSVEGTGPYPASCAFPALLPSNYKLTKLIDIRKCQSDMPLIPPLIARRRALGGG